ncbi:MAG: hypothetical protein O3B65_02010 [Chloroflexi bacterium]|nr:hypothetical protein [Chloroflexota bacterium]
MKKTRIVVVMSAGLLALAALGGTAFAHWGPGNAEATYEKIAEGLGQDQETVSDAFGLASDEARDEAIAAKLAHLVESGALTQAEADEIQAWYDSAPAALNGFPLSGARADIERVAEILGVDAETLKEVAGTARNDVAAEVHADRLNEAVAEGRITQEQADEMLAQFESRRENGMDHRGGRGSEGRGPEGRGHRGFGGFGEFHRGMAAPDDAPVLDADALAA